MDLEFSSAIEFVGVEIESLIRSPVEESSAVREISVSHYPTEWQTVLSPFEAPPLDAGQPQREKRDELANFQRELSSSGLGRQAAIAQECCLSGAWLLHNFLDESHSLSQDIENSEGSFWHGIMHRRERDFGNSKYWFRRTGKHPIYEELHRDVAELIAGAESNTVLALGRQSSWQPDRFVDLCQDAIEGGLMRNDSAVNALQSVAFREWQLLFDYCFQDIAT